MNVKLIKEEIPVTEADMQKVQDTVSATLKRVRDGGDKYLQDYYGKKFGTSEPISFLISRDEAAKTKEQLSPELIEGLEFAIERVTDFAQAQKDSITEFEKEMLPGIHMGQRVIPVESCGCYLPAGNYPCATSGVMCVAPAKVAGVKRIVCCSPASPDKGIDPAILYTLYKMGVEEIYSFGGAHAIAVLAYGTESIPPVDLIVGPGNQWVTEAKRQVYGRVGIDFLAGPSECLVIADETARADYIAADLLAQCEHDLMARGALVTTSETLANQLLDEVERQLADLKTEEVARHSWEHKGIVAVVPTIEDACAWANDYATEHLEVHTKDPKALLPLLTSYGSLFLGESTAEVFADKVAGTNHVLPTLRAAKYTGGLWVGNYMKVITHQWVDEQGVQLLAPYSVRQAEHEKMDAHRRAALIRLTNKL